MIKFDSYDIDASGITIDPNTGFEDFFINPLIRTSANIVLTDNVIIAPTKPNKSLYFRVRWEADVTLSSFSVSICGDIIAQDCVNQTGTFYCNYDKVSDVWSVQYFPDYINRPQEYNGVFSRNVPNSGALTLKAGVDKQYQRLVGTPTTLTGNYTVSADTGVKDGSMFFIEIAGGVTIGSNIFTIFGNVISSGVALNGGAMVIATYDATGSVWRSVLVNKEVALNTIAKIAGNSVIGNSSSGTSIPTVITAPTDGMVLKRDAGILGFGFVTPENLDGSFAFLKVATTNLSSSDILALFTTPVNILSAPPSGTYNIIHSILIEASVGSPNTAYDTNTGVEFYYNGSTDKIASASTLLAFTNNAVFNLPPKNPTNADGNILSQDLMIKAIAGNPASGTGSLRVRVLYYTVTPDTNLVMNLLP